MPSGYEKSPDYGGPEPKLWLLALVLFSIILAGGLYYWGFR